MFSATKLEAAFDRVTDYWSPKVIGRLNDQPLKAAKLKGELVWHAHDGEDELFYIVKGELRIEFEDGADEECWVLLIEPASTLHTGAEITDRTRSLEEQLS